jgi:hypothetical protein
MCVDDVVQPGPTRIIKRDDPIWGAIHRTMCQSDAHFDPAIIDSVGGRLDIKLRIGHHILRIAGS